MALLALPGTGLTTQSSETRSIETRASWVVAGDFACPARPVVRRTVDHRGRTEGDRRRNGRRTFSAGAGELTRLVRLGGRRHSDGPHRRPFRHPLDRDLRRRDDLHRAADLDRWRAVAALCRPRPVHGLAGQRRPQRAALCLCQPLVRPAPRFGARPDLERRLSRGLRVADDLRARHRQLRLALDHDRLRRVPGRADRAARSVFPPPAAQSCRTRDAERRRGGETERCSAGRRTSCSA